MKDAQLLHEVKIGRLLIVGEFRGAAAEFHGFVNHANGRKTQHLRAVFLIECACRGNVDRATLYCRLPESIETPEEAVFPYEKGRKYVFFLTSIKKEHGQVIGYLSERLPELIEEDNAQDGGAATAPQGAGGAPTP